MAGERILLEFVKTLARYGPSASRMLGALPKTLGAGLGEIAQSLPIIGGQKSLAELLPDPLRALPFENVFRASALHRELTTKIANLGSVETLVEETLGIHSTPRFKTVLEKLERLALWGDKLSVGGLKDEQAIIGLVKDLASGTDLADLISLVEQHGEIDSTEERLQNPPREVPLGSDGASELENGVYIIGKLGKRINGHMTHGIRGLLMKQLQELCGGKPLAEILADEKIQQIASELGIDLSSFASDPELGAEYGDSYMVGKTSEQSIEIPGAPKPSTPEAQLPQPLDPADVLTQNNEHSLAGIKPSFIDEPPAAETAAPQVVDPEGIVEGTQESPQETAASETQQTVGNESTDPSGKANVLKDPKDVEIEKLQEALQQTSTENAQLKEQARRESIGEINVKTTPEQDAEALTKVATKIVIKEFSRGNSFFGIAYNWFGGWFLPEEVPRDINKLSEYLAGQLLNGEKGNQFKEAVQGYLEQKEGYSKGLGWMQKHALNSIRFLRWTSKFLPEDMRKRIGEAAYAGDHGGTAAVSHFFGGKGSLLGSLFNWGYGLFRHYIAGYVDVYNEEIGKIYSAHWKHFTEEGKKAVVAAKTAGTVLKDAVPAVAAASGSS